MKAMLAAVFAYIIWGFSFMASKKGQENASPFLLLAYRFDLATVFLALPVLFKKAEMKLRGKRLLPLILLGVCEPCVYFIGEQYGLHFSNAAFSGIMISIIPITTMVLAKMFLHDVPSRAQWLFSLLSIWGVVCITLVESSGGEVTGAGIILLSVAVISASVFGVLNRGIKDEFTVFERSFFMQLMGAVFFTLLAFIEKRGDVGELIAPAAEPGFLLSVLYLALGASVAGYVLYNYAVSNAPVANVASLCNLTTVLSVITGVLFLDEPFSAVSAAAIAAVLVGIWGVQKYSPENNIKNTIGNTDKR